MELEVNGVSFVSFINPVWVQVLVAALGILHLSPSFAGGSIIHPNIFLFPAICLCSVQKRGQAAIYSHSSHPEFVN